MAGKSDASSRGLGPAVDRLIAHAADLLGPVQLVDDLTFSNKATVVRLRVAGGATMIAKQPRRREMFVRELEALRLLLATVRPALLASSSDLIVVEDLGPGPSLADLLLGDEPNAAEQALVGWAETLGHALRATLREGQAAAPEDIPAGVEGLKRLSAELDVEVRAGVNDDAARSLPPSHEPVHTPIGPAIDSRHSPLLFRIHRRRSTDRSSRVSHLQGRGSARARSDSRGRYSRRSQ